MLTQCCFMHDLLWCDLCSLQGVLGFKLQGPEGQGLSVDVSSLPLVLHHLSTVTYLSCR